MPVRFPCPKCHQVLSVTRRKIGSQVSCPRCGNSNLVPDEETGAASVANFMISRPAAGRELISELIVYDDVPALIGENPASAGRSAAMPTPPAPPSSSGVGANGASGLGRSTSGATAHSVAGDLLLISRRTLYFQGVLFVIVAAAAFSAGFFIGRGPTPEGKGPNGPGGANEPVTLRGTVLYARAGGNMQPDEGTIIAALPEGILPDDLIPATGLRPQDPDNPDAAGIKAIAKLGGDYVRADPSGNFQLVVPKAGPYHLLIVSRQAKRARGKSIQEPELQEMAGYFSAPADLIGTNQYHWSLQHLSGSPEPMVHQFKADGK
jgi:hypothetical protein